MNPPRPTALLLLEYLGVVMDKHSPVYLNGMVLKSLYLLS